MIYCMWMGAGASVRRLEVGQREVGQREVGQREVEAAPLEVVESRERKSPTVSDETFDLNCGEGYYS